jgi:hypothetical protein
MTQSMEALERRIEQLRAEVRRAVTSGDRVRARALRGELREAQQAWEDGLAELEQPPVVARHEASHRAGPLLPIREQVHQALNLLGVPAAPRLIIAVLEAFFAGTLAPARLTSLRRDEERSFRSAPYARPYYVCAALTADLLAPARGLLAVSTWPMDSRVIGPLSPRVDYLTAAIRVAESILRIASPGPGALRLLRRFAVNIPGAAESVKSMQPDVVLQAARAELEIHQDDDDAHRNAAASRARTQLDDVEQLFGTRLRVTRGAGTSS